MEQQRSRRGIQPSSTDASVDRLSRRRLLVAGATAAAVGVAGCAEAANTIAEAILGDVNLFNQTDGRLTGSISVTDPEGETVLDEGFEIEPETEGDTQGAADDQESGGVTYGDVFTGAGSYTVAASLDDDSAVDGETDSERTVEVTEPAEQHIIVVFGADDFEGPMGAFVIEEFTDIGNYVDNTTD